MEEKDLQNYFKKQCKRHGIYYRKVAAVSVRGFPDCFLLKGGIVYLVELKSPKGTGKLSPHQKREAELLTTEGANYFVAASKKEVDQIIQQLLLASS